MHSTFIKYIIYIYIHVSTYTPIHTCTDKQTDRQTDMHIWTYIYICLQPFVLVLITDVHMRCFQSSGLWPMGSQGLLEKTRLESRARHHLLSDLGPQLLVEQGVHASSISHHKPSIHVASYFGASLTTENPQPKSETLNSKS